MAFKSLVGLVTIIRPLMKTQRKGTIPKILDLIQDGHNV